MLPQSIEYFLNNIGLLFPMRLKFELKTSFFISILIQSLICSGQNPSLEKALEKSVSHYVPDSIIKYGKLTVELSDRFKSPETKARALIALAKGYAGKAMYREAVDALNLSKEIINFIHNDTLEADQLLELGRVYQLQQNYRPALNSFLLGLKFSGDAGLQAEEIKAYVYLAEYYRHLEKFVLADAHIQKALYYPNLASIQGAPVISIYNRYAAIKSETGDFDSSLFFSNKALDLSLKEGNYHNAAVSYNEIGYVFENKKEFSKALAKYKLAELIWDSLGYMRNLANVQENHARTLHKEGKYKESNVVLEKLVKLAIEHNWLEILNRCYGQISDNFSRLHKYSRATAYLNLQNKTAQRMLEQINKNEIDSLVEDTPILKTRQNGEKQNGTRNSEKSVGKEFNFSKLKIGALLFLLLLLIFLLSKVIRR